MRRPDLRRSLALGLCLTLGTAGRLASQDREVRVTVTLTPDTAQRGQRNPEVRTTSGLLTDDRWVSMLRTGFPLRMHYRVEMWRSRSGWFDALTRQVEWDVVVRHEPLLDQY